MLTAAPVPPTFLPLWTAVQETAFAVFFALLLHWCFISTGQTPRSILTGFQIRGILILDIFRLCSPKFRTIHTPTSNVREDPLPHLLATAGFINLYNFLPIKKVKKKTRSNSHSASDYLLRQRAQLLSFLLSSLAQERLFLAKHTLCFLAAQCG